MMALEEFNECEQRFTFLTRERDRLVAIHRRHEQAIDEARPGTRKNSN